MMRLICSLLVAVALVAASPAMGQGYPLNAQGYGLNIAGGTLNVTATGSTTARTLADRAAERINIRNFGAKGDGVTDDSAALAAAINRSNTLMAAGTLAVVYIPAGTYLIKSTPIPAFAQNLAGAVVGDGSWKSIIKLDPSYAGDLFAWSDAWGAGTTNAGNTSIALPTKLGARVEHLSVIGDQSATAQQNAFMLYDHEDQAYFNDVDVQFLHGRAFYAGAEKNDTISYFRESHVQNFRAFNSGMAGIPVFEITSQCTSGGACGDASNEIDIANIDIYGSRGPSLVLRNAQPTAATTGGTQRQIRISKLRIEGSEGNPNSVTADLMTIGDASMVGAQANISCTDCELISPYTNFPALRLTAQTAAAEPIFISFSGIIGQGGGGGSGLEIDAGGGLFFRLQQLSSVQTNLTVAASPMTSGPIAIDGGGNEDLWTTNIDATAVQYVHSPSGRFGSLKYGSSTTFTSAQIPDGTQNGGNNRGMNSTDWQTTRFAAGQAATGQYAVIGGGLDNTAGSTGSVVGGGNSNNSAGFYSAVGGGANNIINGTFSATPGGSQAASFGNNGWLVWADGDFSTQGDAEMFFAVLRASTSSTTATRVTSDAGAVGGSNTLNMVSNASAAWMVDLDCVYRDTVSNAVATWYWKGILMTHGATNATTAVSAPTATAGPTSGTPGATAPALAADTTYGGLSITFTAPNTDASHIVCRARGVTDQ